LAPLHERLFTIGRAATTPIVAAVHGPALAGGTGLAAHAHFVVALRGDTLGLTEMRIGLWPFVIFRAVVAAIGERRAVELGITGRIVDAREAASIGLVQRVTPAAQLDATADGIAAAAAEASPEAIRSGLKFVTETHGIEWDT